MNKNIIEDIANRFDKEHEKYEELKHGYVKKILLESIREVLGEYKTPKGKFSIDNMINRLHENDTTFITMRKVVNKLTKE